MALVVIFLVVVNCLMVQSDPDSNFTVTCTERMFSADWVSNQVTDREVFITLLDPLCNATMSHTSAIDNITFVSINSYFDQCNTVITETNATILITNTARLKISQKLREGATKREYYYDYNIQCELARQKNISTDSFYNVSDKIVILKNYTESKEFKFPLSMDFYYSDSYSSPVNTSLTVNSDENIYVGIKEDNNNTNFKFIVNQCFATPSQQFNDNTSDVFFDNRCSLDSTFVITSAESNHSGVFNFKIQSFLFIQDKGSVYFHCRIYICKTHSVVSECTQRCLPAGKRFRREVEPALRFRRSASPDDVVQEIVITSKKITFDNTQTCENMSPTCPRHSSCHSLEPAACICDDGYVFSRETNTCTSQRRLEIKGIHLKMEWKDIYADTSSLEFRKLAVEKEELLYRLFQATETEREIKGVKVIGARKGSVVLDVVITYAKTTTYETAFKSFMKSIKTKALKATTVHRSLNIIQDTTPSIVHEITKETNKMEKVTLVIVIVVLLVVLLISGITFYKIKQLRRRTTKENISGFDNSGVDMNNLS